MYNQLLPISSIRRPFVVLAVVLLLVNACAAKAQNTNGANSNTNVNAANGNTNNANAAANSNTNVNGNANGNTNANTNVNSNTNQNASTTSSNTFASLGSAKSWFLLLILLMYGFVLLGFAATIMRAIRFSKFTFNSPLGLPDGSLRAILAFLLVSFLGFYVLARILGVSAGELPETLLGIIATVIGFYFGSRSIEDKGTGLARGSVNGTVKDKNGSPAVGANVELSQSGVSKFTKTTDLNGTYKFDGIPVGNYDIKASLAGTDSPSAKVKVTADTPTTVDLQLK